MPRDYYPRQEAAIEGWTGNFRAKIQEHWPQLGLTEDQVDQYGSVQRVFVEYMRAAGSPSERTPSVIEGKRKAREKLEAQTRMLVRIIAAQQGVTLQQRAELRMALRGRGGYKRVIPPPDVSPRLRIRAMEGRIAVIELSDRQASRRRKPRGAASAVIFVFVGKQPADRLADWLYAGATPRTLNRIAFDAALEPGTKIWLTACWVNAHGKRSPMCPPVYTHVDYGGPMLSRKSLKAAQMLYVAALQARTQAPAPPPMAHGDEIASSSVEPAHLCQAA